MSCSFVAISLSRCVCFSNTSSHVDDTGALAASGDVIMVLGTADGSVVDDSGRACIGDPIWGKGGWEALVICCSDQLRLKVVEYPVDAIVSSVAGTWTSPV